MPGTHQWSHHQLNEITGYDEQYIDGDQETWPAGDRAGLPIEHSQADAEASITRMIPSFVSGGIERHAGLIDDLLEIGISNRSIGSKIDLSAKQIFKIDQQSEVPIRGVGGSQAVELHDKVDVALVVMKVVADGGADDVKAHNLILHAKRSELGAMFVNDAYHNCNHSM